MSVRISVYLKSKVFNACLRVGLFHLLHYNFLSFSNEFKKCVNTIVIIIVFFFNLFSSKDNANSGVNQILMFSFVKEIDYMLVFIINAFVGLTNKLVV